MKDTNISKSMMYQELILFDPSRSLVEVKQTTNNQLPLEQPAYSLDAYIKNRMQIATPREEEAAAAEAATKQKSYISMTGGKQRTRRGGSKESTEPPHDYMGEKIGSGDVTALKEYTRFIQKSKKLADRMKLSQVFMRFYCPNTCDIGIPVRATESRDQYVMIGRITDSL